MKSRIQNDVRQIPGPPENEPFHQNRDAMSVLRAHREQGSSRQGRKEGINEEGMPVAGNTRIPAGYKIVAADWHPKTMHASPFDQSQYQHVKH
jgi:hypothetical protein